MAPGGAVRPPGRDRRRIPEKGSQVYIEGSIRTRKWQDKEGKERYSTEIVANEMQMLGGRGGGGGGGGGAVAATGRRRRVRRHPGDQDEYREAPAAAAGGSGGGARDDFDDDIPF